MSRTRSLELMNTGRDNSESNFESTDDILNYILNGSNSNKQDGQQELNIENVQYEGTDYEVPELEPSEVDKASEPSKVDRAIEPLEVIKVTRERENKYRHVDQLLEEVQRGIEQLMSEKFARRRQSSIRKVSRKSNTDEKLIPINTTVISGANSESIDDVRLLWIAAKSNEALVEEVANALDRSLTQSCERKGRVPVRDLPKFTGSPIDTLEGLELHNKVARDNQWDDKVDRKSTVPELKVRQTKSSAKFEPELVLGVRSNDFTQEVKDIATGHDISESSNNNSKDESGIESDFSSDTERESDDTEFDPQLVFDRRSNDFTQEVKDVPTEQEVSESEPFEGQTTDQRTRSATKVREIPKMIGEWVKTALNEHKLDKSVEKWPKSHSSRLETKRSRKEVKEIGQHIQKESTEQKPKESTEPLERPKTRIRVRKRPKLRVSVRRDTLEVEDNLFRGERDERVVEVNGIQRILRKTYSPFTRD